LFSPCAADLGVPASAGAMGCDVVFAGLRARPRAGEGQNGWVRGACGVPTELTSGDSGSGR
jgi:hypothetical protein